MINFKWMLSFFRSPLLLGAALFASPGLLSQASFSTNYFKILINKQGYITSMLNTTVHPQREFSPKDKPSPLLCLYNSSQKTYYKPQKAVYAEDEKELSLYYANGLMATVKIEVKK